MFRLSVFHNQHKTWPSTTKAVSHQCARSVLACICLEQTAGQKISLIVSFHNFQDEIRDLNIQELQQESWTLLFPSHSPTVRDLPGISGLLRNHHEDKMCSHTAFSRAGNNEIEFPDVQRNFFIWILHFCSEITHAILSPSFLQVEAVTWLISQRGCKAGRGRARGTRCDLLSADQ